MSRFLLPVAAIAGLAVAALAYLKPFEPKAPTLTLPGTVEIQEVRLGPRVAGRVARVKVVEGEVVEPGRVLLSLDVPEVCARLDRERARLRAAEAVLAEREHGPRAEEIAAARAEAAATEARLAKLRAGARAEEIERARSELEAAEADLVVARREWERNLRLVAQGVGSRSSYDAALGDRDRLVGREKAARAALDLLLAGTRPEEIAEAEAQLARDRARLDLLLAGTRPEAIAAARAEVDEAEAAVRELEVQRDEATVVAPERAVVEVVAVRPGDLVAAGQPVVRVLRAEDLWVKVYVPETQLGRVRLGQEVEVKTDSYPDTPFAGKVVQVASVSEFTPRNVQSADERRHQVFAIKVRVDDPGGIFKSGMAADVVVPLHRADGPATVAPPEAAGSEAGR